MPDKRNAPAGTLDLVPIMNLVTILIPFLLATATLVTVSVIDTTAPGIEPGKQEVPRTDPPVSVLITDQGYTVTHRDEPVPIPCRVAGCPDEASWDGAELTRVLGALKDRYPDERTVILTAEADVSYGVLVSTMDAARTREGTDAAHGSAELFPEVVIAGGVR